MQILSPRTEHLLAALSKEVDAAHGAKQGRTALYWHLRAVCEKHAAIIYDDDDEDAVP